MNQRINAHQFVYISLRFTRNRYKWLLPNNPLLQHKLISTTEHALYVWKFLRINLKPLAATYSATNAWLIGARSRSNAQFASNLSRRSNTAFSLQMITKSILPLHLSFPWNGSNQLECSWSSHRVQRNRRVHTEFRNRRGIAYPRAFLLVSLKPTNNCRTVRLLSIAFNTLS